jgi:predicted  nucleic acid-binding Zn-ribbon protein
MNGIMNFSQQILSDLKELQELEQSAETPGSKQTGSSAALKEIEKLRIKIPTSILGHYDRQRLRGKASLAPIHNYTCGGCHLQIPKGNVLRLQASHEMGLCDYCSAFIYQPETEADSFEKAPELVATPVTTPAKRGKKTAKSAA